MSEPLTIAELATATGLNPATLRAWEKRYGFPIPRRGAGGQRRYQPEDARAIAEVLAERAGGATLAGAIARVRNRAAPRPGSLFAPLLDARGAAPRRVSRRTMLATSRAVEDELSARAERGLLVGAFQKRRFYDRSSARWRDLERGSISTMVFADFERAGKAEDRPAQVPLPVRSPLAREWAIVCLALRASVVLVGRELPGSSDAHGRTFELLLSIDPELVRSSLEISVAAADQVAPAVAAAFRQELEVFPQSIGPDAGFASALTCRTIAYLDASSGDDSA